MLILDDEHSHLMRTAAEEVKARHAEVFVITDAPHLAKGLDDDPIVIPRNGKLTALLAVLPLQFLAQLALLRRRQPDLRHLAKSVTVDFPSVGRCRVGVASVRLASAADAALLPREPEARQAQTCVRVRLRRVMLPERASPV